VVAEVVVGVVVGVVKTVVVFGVEVVAVSFTAKAAQSIPTCSKRIRWTPESNSLSKSFFLLYPSVTQSKKQIKN
jgi:hypothetical protein